MRRRKQNNQPEQADVAMQDVPKEINKKAGAYDDVESVRVRDNPRYDDVVDVKRGSYEAPDSAL
jgi:hypothetical protein